MGRFEVMHHLAVTRVPAVFLDRDNTLIDNPGDLGDPSQVKLLQGAASAIASLRGLGYKIVVISNQGGVARGKFAEKDVEAVHARIAELVSATTAGKIDRFYYCPYHPEGSVARYRRDHPWRKPQPGMLLEAARELNLDLPRSWLVGDQYRDVQAGAAAGVRTILLAADESHAQALRDEAADAGGRQPPAPDFVARTLAEAARIIAQQRRPDMAEEIHQDSARPRSLSDSPQSPPPLTAKGTAPPLSTSAPPATPTPQPSPPLLSTMATHVAPEPPPSPVKPLSPPPADASRVATPPPDQTLRQILAELRNQRDTGEDFSLLHWLAIFLQAIAALALVAAFWLSRVDFWSFFRWITVALLFQLATVATLLFRKR